MDEVRQVSSILYNKKYRNASNYLKISQKRRFLGKNGPFLARKCVGSDQTVLFSLSAFKLDEVSQFLSILVGKKV